jgi:hypothetical protein
MGVVDGHADLEAMLAAAPTRSMTGNTSACPIRQSSSSRLRPSSTRRLMIPCGKTSKPISTCRRP